MELHTSSSSCTLGLPLPGVESLGCGVTCPQVSSSKSQRGGGGVGCAVYESTGGKGHGAEGQCLGGHLWVNQLAGLAVFQEHTMERARNVDPRDAWMLFVRQSDKGVNGRRRSRGKARRLKVSPNQPPCCAQPSPAAHTREGAWEASARLGPREL